MFETVNQVRVSWRVREKCENGDRYQENVTVLRNMTEKGVKTVDKMWVGGSTVVEFPVEVCDLGEREDRGAGNQQDG